MQSQRYEAIKMLFWLITITIFEVGVNSPSMILFITAHVIIDIGKPFIYVIGLAIVHVILVKGAVLVLIPFEVFCVLLIHLLFTFLIPQFDQPFEFLPTTYTPILRDSATFS